MSDLPTIGAAVNGIMQQAFGEPVVYQSVQAGQSAGDPRHPRRLCARGIWDAGGCRRDLHQSFNRSDLVNFPHRGDWVTAAETRQGTS